MELQTSLNKLIEYNLDDIDEWIVIGIEHINSQNSTVFNLVIVDKLKNSIFTISIIDNVFFTNLENILMKVTNSDSKPFVLIITDDVKSKKFENLMSNMNVELNYIISVSQLSSGMLHNSKRQLMNKSLIEKYFEYWNILFKDRNNICLNEEIFNKKDVFFKDYSMNLTFNEKSSSKEHDLFKIRLDPEKMDKNFRKLLSTIIMIFSFNEQPSLLNIFDYYTIENSKYMHLDLNTYVSLNIFSSYMNKLGDKKSNFNFAEKNISFNLDKRSFNFKKKEKESVYEILNQCCTKIGSRFLHELMCQPLQSKEEIDLRLDLVTFFLNNFKLTSEIRKQMFFIDDLSLLIAKLTKFVNTGKCNIISFENLYNLKKSLASLETISNLIDPFCVQKNEEETYFINIARTTYFDELTECLEKSSNLKKFLSKVIDVNKLGELSLNHTIDQRLTKIQESINKNKDKIEKIKKNSMYIADQDDENSFSSNKKKNNKTTNKEKIRIEEYKDLQVIFVPKALIKYFEDKDDYELISTTNAGSKYITKEMRIICKEIVNLKQEYKDVSKSLMEKVLEVVSSYINVIEKLTFLVGSIDVISSFAVVIKSSKTILTRPVFCNNNIVNSEINNINNSSSVNKSKDCFTLADSYSHDYNNSIENRFLSIKGGRHFILEQNSELTLGSNYISNRNNESESVLVPNDCELNKDTRIMLLTGVNMGGKSTYLRTVGLIVYLAHLGMFIPAEENTIIPITDKIITRVGADDNLLKGFSTFFNEIQEVASMLNVSSKNSLLLIDEIGRGTSTLDGISISGTILKEIAEKLKCFSIYATHFHELTKLNIEGVCNYKVEYILNEEMGLEMKYKVSKGCTGNSLGLQLLKFLQMDYLDEYM